LLPLGPKHTIAPFDAIAQLWWLAATRLYPVPIGAVERPSSL
jgi:hypothetical protein